MSPQKIAKQMQEEEEQRIRRRSRGQEDHSEGTIQVLPLGVLDSIDNTLLIPEGEIHASQHT